MTKQQLIDSAAATTGQSKAETERNLEAILEAIAQALCQGHFENRPKGGGKSDQRADQNTGKISRLTRAGPERRAAEPSGEAVRRGDPARERGRAG